MKLAAGTRLGPYEILAPLGAGGMGEVYRARDTRLERDVALKVVAGRHGEDLAALRRFAREAKIAARLTHPNVCTLFDADTDLLGTVGYMAPEMLRGEPPAPAADLWALGCVLFECLSGRRAFSGRTAQETFASTLSKPPDFAALPPNVSSELCALLERLLDKDPATRLADAAAVERELSGGSVPSAPPLQPRRRLALAVAAVALIGAAAAAWLGLARTGEVKTRLVRNGAEGGLAHELWLKGRQHLSRITGADHEKALVFFRQALEADPNYARAWAGVGEVDLETGWTGQRPHSEAYAEALKAGEKAVSLEPGLAEGHAVLANALAATGEQARAEAEFRRALALDPDNLYALHNYSHLLLDEKRWDESLVLCKKLLDLDPKGFWNVHLGEHYLQKGDRALALEQFRRAADLDPASAPARWHLGRLLSQENRVEEAIHEFETAYKLDPNLPFLRDALAEAYQKAGRAADAARLRAESPGPKR